jgi:hypothetical protein
MNNLRQSLLDELLRKSMIARVLVKVLISEEKTTAPQLGKMIEIRYLSH